MVTPVLMGNGNLRRGTGLHYAGYVFLSTVPQADIVSLYPSTDFAHRSLLHARISSLRKKEAFEFPVSTRELYIMWSRDFSTELAVFNPNHVVPVFNRNDSEYRSKIETVQLAAKRPNVPSIQQPKITSFCHIACYEDEESKRG